MGLGHVRRQLVVAQTLTGQRPAPSILMICCAKEAAAFTLPAGIDCLALPGIGKTVQGEYRGRRLHMPLGDLVRLRAQTMRAAVESFDPDLVLVDKVAGGFQGELTPTLRWLKERARAACILGLREILDEPEVARREWIRDRCAELIEEFYAGVWIYGDPAVIDTAAEYGFAPGTVGKCSYTGYLNAMELMRAHAPDAAPAPRWTSGTRTALCVVGGGDDGEAIARAFAAATLPEGFTGLLVTGPYMSREAREEVKGLAERTGRVQVHEFVTEPERFVARADCVIAMGGYNTVCEVLGAGKPLLTVPRVRPRREQAIRVERLRALGLLDVLQPEDLTPQALSAWVASGPRATRDARTVVRFDGLARLREMSQAILDQGRMRERVGRVAV